MSRSFLKSWHTFARRIEVQRYNLNVQRTDLRKNWFLVLGILHCVQGKLLDDVSGAAVGPETSSSNLPCTPCKIPKTKNQYSFHGESLKSRYVKILRKWIPLSSLIPVLVTEDYLFCCTVSFIAWTQPCRILRWETSGDAECSVTQFCVLPEIETTFSVHTFTECTTCACVESIWMHFGNQASVVSFRGGDKFGSFLRDVSSVYWRSRMLQQTVGRWLSLACDAARHAPAFRRKMSTRYLEDCLQISRCAKTQSHKI